MFKIILAPTLAALAAGATALTYDPIGSELTRSRNLHDHIVLYGQKIAHSTEKPLDSTRVRLFAGNAGKCSNIRVETMVRFNPEHSSLVFTGSCELEFNAITSVHPVSILWGPKGPRVVGHQPIHQHSYTSAEQIDDNIVFATVHEAVDALLVTVNP